MTCPGFSAPPLRPSHTGHFPAELWVWGARDPPCFLQLTWGDLEHLHQLKNSHFSRTLGSDILIKSRGFSKNHELLG